MIAIEREYLCEDIKQCSCCKTYIEDKKYMFINKKWYFHNCCYLKMCYLFEIKQEIDSLTKLASI